MSVPRLVEALPGPTRTMRVLTHACLAISTVDTHISGYQVCADPEELQQILLNLVRYAIRFTAPAAPSN